MLEAFAQGHFEEVLRHAKEDLENKIPNDREAINAVSDINFVNRSAVMYDWLTRYQVLRGLSRQSSINIVDCILKYVDNFDDECRISLSAVVMDLEQHCINVLNNQNENAQRRRRNALVLASKVLWCKYPEDLPIFDRHVERVLIVLSKIYHDEGPINNLRYCKYTQA